MVSVADSELRESLSLEEHLLLGLEYPSVPSDDCFGPPSDGYDQTGMEDMESYNDVDAGE